ncbi:MAG: LuxR C-terminal-related transcriptional regulator [Thermonemataceae bacterium]
MQPHQLSPVTKEAFLSYWQAVNHAPTVITADDLFIDTIKAIPSFALGPYFWYVVDFTTLRVVRAGGDSKVIGQEISYWLDKSLLHPDIYEMIHPDDVAYVMSHLSLVPQYLQQVIPHKRKDAHFSLLFRLKVGEVYKTISSKLQDWYFDENNEMRFALVVFTDVSYLGDNHKIVATFLDTSLETIQQFCTDSIQCPPLVITERELEIIRLLATGYASKQIAYILGISKNTVENHRQNLLKKTNSQSSAALVAYAFKNGII